MRQRELDCLGLRSKTLAPSCDNASAAALGSDPKHSLTGCDIASAVDIIFDKILASDGDNAKLAILGFDLEHWLTGSDMSSATDTDFEPVLRSDIASAADLASIKTSG